jgi:NADPH:quinone reductase-like Zn-dependent oxidoreductase
MGRHWSYGEVARVPAHAVAPLPTPMSWSEGAAIWMSYLTAWGGLVGYGHLARGEHVVIRAASSSVGIAALQVANHVGAIPIAVTRTSAKRDFIEAQGAAHVIASAEEDMAERILGITGGRGAGMIFDPVAGPELPELARATAYHGRLFVYGRLSPEPTPFPVNAGLARGLTVRGYSIFEVVNFPDMFARGKAAVLAGLHQGVFRPVIDRTFALDEVAAAHRHMESNAQRGKIVVTV